MQLEALQVFCDVIRCRSFSQAAAANHLTQSAASQIVLQLERRLGGVMLVDRSTRPLRVTEAGQRYFEGSKELLERFIELEASITTQARAETPVQVAAIYSVGLGDMSQLMERFLRERPTARIQIEYLHPDRVYEKVQDGAADFGLVSFPRRSRGLTVAPWREEEMVLVCPPAHPLAACRAVQPSQLQGIKYVGFDRDLVIRRAVDRFLHGHGVEVEMGPEFDNIENIKKAIEVSAGVALLPEPTLRREVEAGTLVAVPLTGARLVRPLGIIQRQSHPVGVTARAFLSLLRQAESTATSDPSKPNRPARRRSSGSDSVRSRRFSGVLKKTN